MTKGIEMANQLTAAIARPAAPKHAATSETLVNIASHLVIFKISYQRGILMKQSEE